MTLTTDLGPVEALSFAANRESEQIVPDIPLDEQARMIASAEGLLGPNFDYLADAYAHLKLLGINDPYVADLFVRTTAFRAVS